MKCEKPYPLPQQTSLISIKSSSQNSVSDVVWTCLMVNTILISVSLLNIKCIEIIIQNEKSLTWFWVIAFLVNIPIWLKMRQKIFLCIYKTIVLYTFVFVKKEPIVTVMIMRKCWHFGLNSGLKLTKDALHLFHERSVSSSDYSIFVKLNPLL